MCLVPVIAPLLQLLSALSAVHGTVRESGHGPVLANVVIAVDGVGRARTDSTGRYAIRELSPGSHHFEFAAIGFRARQVTLELADATDLALDIELTPAPAILPPIEVTARPPSGLVPGVEGDAPAWREAGSYRLGAGWQQTQLAGDGDVLQAISRLPGITSRNENAIDLSIRGGRGSENLVLLDGVPLTGAVHFGGASSAVNPDAIAELGIHTGVSSAQYGGALTGLIDLRTPDSPPDRARLTGALSSTDLRSTLRVPIGDRGGALVGARATYRSLFTDASGLGRTNGYHDAILAVTLPIGSGQLHLVGFGQGNRLHWGLPVGDTGIATSQKEETPPINGADWTSGAAGITWSVATPGGASWQTTGWWSGAGATMTASNRANIDRVESSLSELGLRTVRRQAKANGTMLFGGALSQPRTRYTIMRSVDSTTSLDLRRRPPLGALFGEWEWDGAGRIDARLGLRLETDFNRAIFLDPRLLVHLHLGAGSRLEAGFGRTHQVVQSMLNEENVGNAILGPTLPLASAPGDPIAGSNEWSFGLQQRLGRRTVLALDAYRRNWRDVLSPATTTSGLFALDPRRGNGHAEGLLATLLHEQGRLGLTTTAGIATATQESDGISYQTGATRPWQFSGDLRWLMGHRTLIQLAWTTGAGQARSPIAAGIEWRPFQPGSGSGEIEGTPTTLPGAVNGLRLADPVRIDLGARREWGLGSESHQVLSTAVRLQNVLGRTNPVGVIALGDGSFQWLRGAGRGVILELGWRL